MLGAIAGDVIGSVYEGTGFKKMDFPLFSTNSRFTDDTVLTVAVAECLLRGDDYVETYHRYFDAYPGAGYGRWFRKWAQTKTREPYGSMGNGSAMRVSPVAYAFDSLHEVLVEAKRAAEPTHDHPEGIKGAQATAAAIYLARQGSSKAEIKDYVQSQFGYDLQRTTIEIRENYLPDGGCPGSVPESIICFLESCDFEDAVRKAISLGGDADTMACIAGAIAEAFFGGVPSDIQREVTDRLDRRLRCTIQEFVARFQTQWRPM